VAGAGLTVACVLWVGDFRGRAYTVDYAHRLRSMCARRLSVPHRFICLSNCDVPDVDVVPLADPRRVGWWAKTELFRPGALPPGRVVYLDLDIIVTGDLDAIASHPLPRGSLGAAPPSYRWHGAAGGPSGGRGIVDRVQSTCLTFYADDLAHLWSEWSPAVADRLRGDQDWLGERQPAVTALPGAWFAKLRDCTGGAPEGVRVVASMPWKNHVAAQRFSWVAREWT